MRLSYVVSYALVAALAVAALTVLFQLGLWLGSPRSGRTGERAPSVRAPSEQAPVEQAAGTRSFRRCESCRLRWRAAERDRASALRLWSARLWRRTRRQLTASSTRLPASWGRCPRCLSTQVRASRASARR